MFKIIVEGGNKLHGVVDISGSKNEALPIVIASILIKGTVKLYNVPYLTDVLTIIQLLTEHGANVTLIEKNNVSEESGIAVQINSDNLNNFVAEYELVKKMRASILVLGPLLARIGKAKVSLPGGCAIGARPVDLHIDAFKQFGVKITLVDGYLLAETTKKLKGNKIKFPQVSVGATENIIMLTVLVEGVSVIENVATEPEIISLCNFLVKAGAKIKGIGTNILEIEGVKKLDPIEYKINPDRIETGTYAVAAAMTNGEIQLINTDINLFQGIKTHMEQVGIKLQKTQNGIVVSRKEKNLKNVNFITQVYPGFPTDMQAQFMSMMCNVKGKSVATETIFENRFMHVHELNRMGANITQKGNKAYIEGVKKLKGAKVMATDLRASVSLILAGLVADGITEISRIYHLDRGYEFIEVKLQNCGANIKRRRV